MKLATFNINNVNKRLSNMLAWLKDGASDHAPAWIELKKLES